MSRLCITEEEYAAEFSVEVRFTGRISAMISTRDKSTGYYKYMEGDIASIIADTIRQDDVHSSAPGQFDIHEATQTVRTIVMGKCNFRYGIEQHINVEQHKLLDVLTNINNEPPPKYRPVFLSENTR